MRRGLTGVLVVIALGVAGCSDPYAAPPPDRADQPTSSPTATPEQAASRPQVGDTQPAAAPPTPISEPPTRRALSSPTTLARAYAEQAVNWDWRGLANGLRVQRGLAAGPLEAELQRTAASVAVDESLARDRPGGRGHVLAVAVSGHGAERRVVVVTREQELQRGHATLEGERARVYTGAARLTDAGWRMWRWEREP